MRRLKLINGLISLSLVMLMDATAWGLDKPINLNAISVTAQSVTLSWENKDSTVTHFRVQRSSQPDSGWTKAGIVTAPLTTFTDTLVPPGQTVYYRVRAAVGSKYFSL